MEKTHKPYATHEDLQLAQALLHHPDFCMMDEHGNPTGPRKQDLCRKLQSFIDSHNWEPKLFEEDGKVGLWNQFSHTLMVPPIYDSFSELPVQTLFCEITEDGVIARLNGKWGVVSSDGDNLQRIPFFYDRISRYEYEGWFILELEGLLGLSTSEGDLLLPCCADKIWYDKEIGLDLYSRNQMIGLINPKTEAIFESVGINNNIKSDQYHVVAQLNGRDYYLSADEGQCIPVELSDFLTSEKLRIFNM